MESLRVTFSSIVSDCQSHLGGGGCNFFFLQFKVSGKVIFTKKGVFDAKNNQKYTLLLCANL